MNEKDIIQKTADYVKSQLSGETTGHDWWHSYRVWKMACKIVQNEKANTFIVELAALLHDIADYKLHNGDEDIGPKTAEKWLRNFAIPEETIKHISEIIRKMSFKGARFEDYDLTIEGKIVQDADWLDTLGAIGIARIFAMGGKFGEEIHDPNSQVKFHSTSQEYKNRKNTSINHFYEKILLLKDKMNTQTAKDIAQLRHQYIENYLAEFFKEWNLTN